VARGSNLARIGDSLAENLMVDLMQVNPTALRTLDALRINQRAIGKATEALATGQRVNSASDDAASLDVGRVMTSQYRGVLTAVKNIHDGLSLTQTAGAALDSIGQSLQRMRELAVQAATGTLNDTQRGHLDAEYQEHQSQILAVVQKTQWNGYRLLRELSPTTFDVQAGADANQTIPITIPQVYADGNQVGFPNGDFESSAVGATSVNGWTVNNARVRLNGIDQIGGWPTPVDTTKPGPSGGDTVAMSNGQFSTTVVANTGAGSNPAGGAKSLQMQSTGVSVTGYGIVHGPSLISNTAVPMKTGDSVSFDWKAQGGADAYDVYAYLLNVDNGTTVKMLDATGASGAMTTNWATVTTSVPADGNYKFVFVAGTFDATGGTAAGARLYIDNVVAPPQINPTLNTTDITSVPGTTQAIAQVDREIAQVVSARASLGASLHRLTHAADQLAVHAASLTASRSAAIDADYGRSAEELARSQARGSAAELVLKHARDLDQASLAMIKANEGLFKA
jgi:flagellin-like hook-associated protein FlgL